MKENEKKNFELEHIILGLRSAWKSALEDIEIGKNLCQE
jgi:hypothetical protein